jgi:hypothetical protein
MRLCTIGIFGLIGCLLGISGSVAPAAMIESHFDIDLEGWTGTGEAVSWAASGGNPTGHLRALDNASGHAGFISAPAAYHGDLSGFVGGQLSYDSIAVSGSVSSGSFGTVRIFSGASVISKDPAPAGNPLTTWSTYSTPLTASAFATTSANFLAIMSNVTDIQVDMDFQNSTGETAGFDNFQIVSPVPEPAALRPLALAGLALLRRRRAGRRARNSYLQMTSLTR